ncbi:MAG: hypothetical protein U0003_01690 [Vampirovibrionales bacterium]
MRALGVALPQGPYFSASLTLKAGELIRHRPSWELDELVNTVQSFRPIVQTHLPPEMKVEVCLGPKPSEQDKVRCKVISHSVPGEPIVFAYPRRLVQISWWGLKKSYEPLDAFLNRVITDLSQRFYAIMQARKEMALA